MLKSLIKVVPEWASRMTVRPTSVPAIKEVKESLDFKSFRRLSSVLTGDFYAVHLLVSLYIKYLLLPWNPTTYCIKRTSVNAAKMKVVDLKEHRLHQGFS